MIIKRLTKRILIGILTVSLLLVGSACGSKAKHKVYDIENAATAVANMGAGWSLGNTLDAWDTSIASKVPSVTETCWGNPVATKELIGTIAAAGFKTVRIPVTWRGHIDGDGNIDKAWLDRVQEVVDYCYAYNLYVILNVHHDTGDKAKSAWIKADITCYNDNISRFQNLWTQIAERFIDYDGHLLFEGYNEMLDSNFTWTRASNKKAYTAVNAWAQLFVDTVRATGGNNANRNLIVSTYAASFEKECLEEFELPKDTVDKHLLAEVHVYAPYEFCDGENGVVDKHTVFTTEYEKGIDAIFNNIKSAFVDKGIPVVIGEFAATNKNNDEERIRYTEYYVKRCKEIGAAYIWWDNGKKKEMGLFSRSTYECWFPEIVKEIVK